MLSSGVLNLVALLHSATMAKKTLHALFAKASTVLSADIILIKATHVKSMNNRKIK